MSKAFYRRNLPHLQRDNKPHFLTFCTHLRWILPEAARDVGDLHVMREQAAAMHAPVALERGVEIPAAHYGVC